MTTRRSSFLFLGLTYAKAEPSRSTELSLGKKGQIRVLKVKLMVLGQKRLGVGPFHRSSLQQRLKIERFLKSLKGLPLISCDGALV